MSPLRRPASKCLTDDQETMRFGINLSVMPLSVFFVVPDIVKL